MNAEEVTEFETNPHLNEIIQVRLLDDTGKVANLSTYPFVYFQTILQRLVDDHCG